jgi:hypothetical protein
MSIEDIKTARAEEVAEGKLAAAAAVQLVAIDSIVQNALKWPKRAIRALVALVIVGIVAMSLMAGLYVQERNDQVAQCQAGNSYKSDQTLIWEKLFALSYTNNPPPKGSQDAKLGQEFLQFVVTTNAPANCSNALL